MKKLSGIFSIYFFLLFCFSCVAQNPSKILASNISEDLKAYANAVIRDYKVLVTIDDYDDVDVEKYRIVTVLNKKGMGDIAAKEFYSSSRKIKQMSATIYNAEGKVVKEFKKANDFKDESAVPGGTLYSDDRIKFLEYIPNSFPITVVYESKVNYKSTAFLPRFLPLEYFYASTEKSEFEILNKSNVTVKFKESNLEGYGIETVKPLHYRADNLKAIEPQAYSPEFTSYAPEVKFALTKFSMEGESGDNQSWKGFGKWVHDELLSDTVKISSSVIDEVSELIKNATTDREKARIIYEYMQNRSRYISVQVGIGGWKPIEAKEVHKMGYGDCKGLSNYTRVLLNEMGVDANYVVIYGGRSIDDIDKDFSSTQGNHAILYLPDVDGEQVWLECTSRTNPFGYIANFTDDRDALVITEDGGEILHTTVYETEGNLQITESEMTLKKDGSLNGTVSIKALGMQYDYRENLGRLTEEERQRAYKRQWDYINGLEIKNTTVELDKSKIEVSEKIDFSAPLYCSTMGNILLFKPVVLNRNGYSIKEYKQRNFPFRISRGYVDKDIYTLKLEDGVQVDALPNPVTIEKPYGSYELKVLEGDGGVIVVERNFIINKGEWDASQYEDYLEFIKQVKKHDNAKAALIIN